MSLSVPYPPGRAHHTRHSRLGLKGREEGGGDGGCEYPHRHPGFDDHLHVAESTGPPAYTGAVRVVAAAHPRSVFSRHTDCGSHNRRRPRHARSLLPTSTYARPRCLATTRFPDPRRVSPSVPYLPASPSYTSLETALEGPGRRRWGRRSAGVRWRIRDWTCPPDLPRRHPVFYPSMAAFHLLEPRSLVARDGDVLGGANRRRVGSGFAACDGRTRSPSAPEALVHKQRAHVFLSAPYPSRSDIQGPVSEFQ
ncbi:hypothetical protein B0H16DRAFT_338028 [Mycena metata]|uniref:Uncharacterized protein n=1 Tax=Mycena metata TaxID=1033252 RepID=A0AAD7JPH0_9AGAR|nr:hypothetical protein B0H16DRAFT_338028 [Mycena metata]